MMTKRFIHSIRVRARIYLYGKPKMKQEYLFKLALREKGFNDNKLNISCDHDLGLNYVNGIKLGIKFPDSFYHRALNLIPYSKSYNFYFNGNMSSSGQRASMLVPFMNDNQSIIVSSDEGRDQRKKDKFNEIYFTGLAHAKFGLCPHQLDWPGNKQEMWTYRFIESCFAEAIPVLFKKTPLGINFVRGFNYLWDEELFEASTIIIPEYKKEWAYKNRILAKERFCINDEEFILIEKTL